MHGQCVSVLFLQGQTALLLLSGSICGRFSGIADQPAHRQFLADDGIFYCNADFAAADGTAG